jgi:hypothetical protein
MLLFENIFVDRIKYSWIKEPIIPSFLYGKFKLLILKLLIRKKILLITNQITH